MSIYTSMRSLIVKTPILKDIWYRASYAAKQQRRSEKHDLIHYDDYRALHPECFKMLMGDSQTDVCEVHYAGEAKPKSKPADMPAIWQIEVNNATLIGESNAFIDSEGIAVFNHCYGSNVDYTDPAIMNGHVHTKLGKKHRVNYYSRGGIIFH